MGHPSSHVLSSHCPIPLLPNHSSKSHFKSFLFQKKHLQLNSLSASFYPCTKLPLISSLSASSTISPSHSTEIQAATETIPDEAECIAVGYILDVHGLKGEVCVKPSTDFPELRFSKPGKRWLKVRVSGKETIQEIELTSGRSNPGQKSWILCFKGIDTVDEAKQIVGSTLLVRGIDRPSLEEGEFYTPDLVGMKVLLKETGKLVGTVVDVYNSGASDLLQVMLDSTKKGREQAGLLESENSAGPLVWIPFVDAIVPHVDINRREMLITPPKGLLELNIRSDWRSKKERRLLEWRERKRFQQHLIASKKKLNEMGQGHILQGFSSGNKSQKSLLANQIVGINFKLLQHAMQSINLPYPRLNLNEIIGANSSKLSKNVLRISKDSLVCNDNKEELETNSEQYERGVYLMSKGRVAIILVIDDNKNHASGSETDFVGSTSADCPSSVFRLQELLLSEEKFTKAQDCRASVPLILVSSAQDTNATQDLLLENDYFGFDGEKVQFLVEEKLPVVSSSQTEEKRHKILLKSPWEILQSPVGSGGVFSLLLRHKILENFNELGIEYVEVCSLNQRSTMGHPLFLGFVHSCKADVGISVFSDSFDNSNFDIIFSMRTLKKITSQTKLQFYAVPKITCHVEKVDKEWVDVGASSPNSYHLHCSIYSSLNACPPTKTCLLHITG